MRHFTSSKLEIVLFVSISSMLRSPTIAALVWLGFSLKVLAKLQQRVASPKARRIDVCGKRPSCGLAWHNSPEIT